MRDLKDNSNINEINNNTLFKEPKQQPTHSKNAEYEIINIIKYIEQTMETLENS